MGTCVAHGVPFAGGPYNGTNSRALEQAGARRPNKHKTDRAPPPLAADGNDGPLGKGLGRKNRDTIIPDPLRRRSPAASRPLALPPETDNLPHPAIEDLFGRDRRAAIGKVNRAVDTVHHADHPGNLRASKVDPMQR